MPPDRPDAPTDAEWKVMKIVFESGPTAARDVIRAAEDRHGWSASTVKTLLRRLVDKGHLRTRRVGNSFLYRPSRPAHRALRDSADALLERAVDGAMGPLLQYMVRRSALSDRDVDALRSLLDEHARRARDGGADDGGAR